MRHPLSDPILAELSRLLTDKMGIRFPEEHWNLLRQAIDSAAGELGFSDSESCAQWLLSSPMKRRELEMLAAHLTVGETYLFREPRTFEAVETEILPELIRSRRGTDRSLRIWSAGCSTGEEPYSIAILLHKLIPDVDDWNVTILATDINPRFLQKAAQGIYTEWSFRGVPEWMRERYFKVAKPGRFQIVAHIKKMVTFSYLNLAEDVYPALTNGTNAMDLIFCRNVLMYFSESCAKRVVENLHRSLVDSGWLIVSPVETSHTLFASFASLSVAGVTLYGKTERIERRFRDYEPAMETLRWEPQTMEAETSGREPTFGNPGFDYGISCLRDPEGQPEAAETATDTCERAGALFRQGRYRETVDELLGLPSEVLQDTHALELLARAFANQGRLVEAAGWCEKAIGRDKLNAGCHYLLATVQQERGQIEDAVVTLRRALYLDPKFVLAHFALANLVRLQGGIEQSEKHFANSLSLLDEYRPEDILPESEGMTAGRLMEIIHVVRCREMTV